MRRRPARSFSPPLDLRFIDLFMTIVLALAFIAIMLTVVARMLPTETAAPPPQTRQEKSVTQLRKQLDASERARKKVEAELRTVRAQAAAAPVTPPPGPPARPAFTLPWWLIGFCALLGVLAVFMGWRIRLWTKGRLPRARTWILVGVVVVLATAGIRSLTGSDGELLLAAIPWWAADALCLGLLLVAYVLVSVIKASRETLGQIRARAATRTAPGR
ncbi:hypothetical protein SAMN05421874_106293 [Nonomuraea maritima]|uniref:Uncharacterized protein n=1 Tax=Nonomuraea maritima TaxID=683260 RepID=A0A1G9APN4_9ACTN|nr:hypothetical protein [Nonomuraea maritima]SDK29292.1 hypothetical protein SAMN05421874_106293 [Nonomuraea maritima]